MYLQSLNEDTIATFVIGFEQNTDRNMSAAEGLLLLFWSQQEKMPKKGQENKLQGRTLGCNVRLLAKAEGQACPQQFIRTLTHTYLQHSRQIK